MASRITRPPDSDRKPTESKSDNKILLVDDEQDILALIKHAFQKYQYNFDAFSDPSEALLAFNRSPHEYCLVITDIRMPGMTGFELAEQLHHERTDIQVLYMTAYLAEEMAKQSRNLDKRDIIEKPFSIERFCAEVRQRLKVGRKVGLENTYNNGYVL